jgi:hypothetical protein
MNSVKLEVQWSPVHSNKFITWGTEICLYEIAQIKDTVRPSCKFSLQIHFHVRNFEHRFIISLVL